MPFENTPTRRKVSADRPPAARALFSGATNIERVDCLVKSIAAQKGMHSDALDEIVARVDARLEANRRAA